MEEIVESGELIPGLPDHVAMLCLMRVPRLHHSSLRAVCKSWNSVLHSQGFYQFRRKLGLADGWLFVLSTDVASSPLATCHIYDLRTRQLMCKVPLPSSFELAHKASVDGYKLAGVDGSVLLLGLGGRKSLLSGGPLLLPQQQEQKSDDHIYVFDTVVRRWRQGAAMRVPRSSFGSGVIDGLFYVAGGYSRNGHWDASTEVYDLRKDEWRKACDMPLALDTVESSAVFGGKLYVRGFQMETQQEVVLVYDPASDSWHRDQAMGNSDCLQDGELVTTDASIFNLTLRDSFQKYDSEAGEWRNVGTAGHPANDAFNIHAQRALGHKGEIFVLTGEMAGLPRQVDGVLVHSLFLGSSWYRAGAILQA